MANDTTTTAEKLGWWDSIRAYFERRSLVMLMLGFASGLPNLLIFDTLSIWLRESNATLAVIGFFSLATVSYALKFVWAPLVDRTTIPVLTRMLGHRRSWMLVTQAVIVLGLWLISGSNPSTALGTVALFAVMVGFAGATQDIAIDAWRIEAASDARQGVLAAAYQLGWRVALITAGAAPLILADLYNWNISYAVMAALMGFGVLGVLLAPREKAHVIRPIAVGAAPRRPASDALEWAGRLALILFAFLVLGAGISGTDLFGSLAGYNRDGAPTTPFQTLLASGSVGVAVQLSLAAVGLGLIALACLPMPGRATRPGVYLGSSFGDPLRDFFKRFSGLALAILALICLYRLADFVLNIMGPFYTDLGFTRTEIAEVRKVFGVIVSSAGVIVGGFSVARLGLIRTMVIGAFASPVSNLVFAWLVVQGPDLSALFVAIGVDNFASGYAGTALIAYMSGLTSAGFTATQYALFSSLYALPGKLIASQSGRLIEAGARAAENGGLMGSLTGLFAHLPAGSLAEGAATSGVSPAALGAGYFAFFIYSSIIGVFAILLAFYVAKRQPAVEAEARARAAEQEAETQPS